MDKVTLNGRTYAVTPTGMQNAAYKLTSGRLTLTGLRNQHNRDVIIAIDKSGRSYGMFSETTGRELVALK